MPSTRKASCQDLIQETVLPQAQGVSSEQPTAQNLSIVFRKEQEQAIQATIACFGSEKRMLWDAKMRFGKTLCALEVVKRCGFKRTLILTHRPAVRSEWFDDFAKIGFSNYHYGSKAKTTNAVEKQRAGLAFQYLEENARKEADYKYVYFASMQDMRGSKRVNKKSNLDKNNELFTAKWDLLIIDEAHEGVMTKLGSDVVEELQKKRGMKTLYLSGTPYNIRQLFSSKQVYRWDYNMEQAAKAAWADEHPGEPNPYRGLASMNILTYNLGKVLRKYRQTDTDYFSFTELFRVNDETNCFEHESDVRAFLNLLTQEGSNYPFSTDTYRRRLKHTLWSVPGVKAARCLAQLLSEQSSNNVFKDYAIVNVAGDGDTVKENEDITEFSRKENDALERVKAAIKLHDKTITLTCGRLTMGVSVPEWTGVMMLSGAYDTGATRYLQTIFRSQTPFKDGRIKEQCYAFDFAPDRTTTVIDQFISDMLHYYGQADRISVIEQFLHYCPILMIDGAKAVCYNAETFIKEVNKAYADNLIRKGFKDRCLYRNLDNLKENDIRLLDLVAETIAKGKAVGANLGRVSAIKQMQAVEGETFKKEPTAKRTQTEKPRTSKPTKTPEQLQREMAFDILNRISSRFPLMIYGSVDKIESLTLDSFIKEIDADSWNDFMPSGITMALFAKLKHFYREDIFVATAKAIIDRVKAADKLPVEERINEIADILSDFQYPDKETVLTPWRVVNIQLSETLGGYDFYDKDHQKLLREPRFVYNGEVTDKVFMNPNAKLLELNSKTGLYPLYMAYSIFKIKSGQVQGLFDCLSEADSEKLWEDVIGNNIFILCKSKMSEMITRRTLVGFKDAKVNILHFDDIINQISNNSNLFAKYVVNGKSFWKVNNIKKMKFDAIVGNPPYQVMDNGNGVSAKPVYNKFVDIARKISPSYISMIMPARWYVGGKGLDDFRESMLTDSHLVKLFDYPNYHDLFPSADIAGGICYFLWSGNHDGKCAVYNVKGHKLSSDKRRLNEYDIFIRDNKAVEIVDKVMAHVDAQGSTLRGVISSRKPFGLPTTYAPRPSGVPCWFVQKIGRQYANAADIVDPEQNLGKWKLLIPPAPIAGQTDFTKPVGLYYESNVRIAAPSECCTEAWLVAFASDSREEVESFKSYLFTKTVRFLVLQGIISQHVTKKSFLFVPDLGRYDRNFTDEYLCELWNIDDEEWKWIDSKVK
mgnify:CR=1 FL=1